MKKKEGINKTVLLSNHFMKKWEEATKRTYPRSEFVLTRSVMKRLLTNYTEQDIRVAMRGFFFNEYAKECQFPLFLFQKKFNNFFSNPLDYPLLVRAHWIDPGTGQLYADAKDRLTDFEKEILERARTGQYGTLFDIDEVGVEKLLARVFIKWGREKVPKHLIQMYLHLKTITEDKDKLEEAVLAAKKKEAKLKEKEEEIIKYRKVVDSLVDLSFWNLESKKKKWDYIKDHPELKILGEEIYEQICSIKDSTDGDSLLDLLRKRISLQEKEYDLLENEYKEG